MNMCLDVSDFCIIENLIWLDHKPQSEIEIEPKILFENNIEEDLFEICCKFIGKESPSDSFFGRKYFYLFF